MSGNKTSITEDEWNKLSAEEKLKRLEPRVMLLVVMARQSYKVMKENNLLTQDYKNKMEALNLAVD